MKTRLAIAVVILGLVPATTLAQRDPVSVPAPGTPAAQTIPILKDVRIDQKLDAVVPQDLAFVDEAGKGVKLGDYLGKRPVVLALVYYDCPMLCSLVLSGMVASMSTMNLEPGQDFEVVVVSFNPGEAPSLAANTKQSIVKRYGKAGANASFHFLTGRPEPIAKLADAVGFHYAWDPSINQYAHPAALTVLTPQGHVSKYLFGVEFAPRDLRLALVEASGNKIGTVLDQALLYCYHYDPFTGRYGVAIMSLVRIGGILTVGGVAAAIVVSLRRERRRQSNAARQAATGTR